jgi:purine-nucleoside phosphorylase
LEQSDKITKGAILTSEQPIVSIAKKRATYQKTRALAVDMESFHVLEICQGLEIPFFCVRAVSDRADQSIPEEISKALRPDGTIRILSLALGTIKRPSLLPELLNLGRGFSVACRRLRQLLPKAVKAIYR